MARHICIIKKFYFLNEALLKKLVVRIFVRSSPTPRAMYAVGEHSVLANKEDSTHTQG